MATKRKRPRGTLTRDEIAVTALRLLDEHGLESVTMRQLAAELDVAVMSLYVHTANKQEIITAAAEVALAQMPHARDDLPPRAAVVEYFEGFRHELLVHPSVAQAIATSPLVGPAVFASMDSLFRTLHRAGLDEPASVAAVTGLMSFTLGFVSFSTARDRMDPESAAARGLALRGIDPQTFPDLYQAGDYLLTPAFDEQFTEGLHHLVAAYVPESR